MSKWQHAWALLDEPPTPAGRSADGYQRGPIDPALFAAIQHITAPAFVIASSGRVVAANPPGRVRHASRPSGGRAHYPRGGPDPARFEVTPSRPGPARTFLAVLRVSQSVSGTASPPVHWCLTPREHEVIALLARGVSNQQIACTLACTLRTVEHHVSNILRKAQVDNRTALIVALLAR
jgi:DNA-binding CsgD family transcriptional regulator